MTFKNTFILTTSYTFVKVLTGIVMNKAIAVYLGPSGLVMIAQFQNFSGVITGIANASIQTGVVKKTAEQSSKNYRIKVWSNAAVIIFVLSFISTIIVMSFAEFFSNFILFDVKYSGLIQVFSISILFFASNIFFLSLFNGLNKVKIFAFINISLNLLQLVIGLILMYYLKVEGVIYGIIFTQFIIFILTYLLILKKQEYNFFKFDLKNIDFQIIKDLLKFGVVSFLSGLLLSFAMLIVRYMIIDANSLEFAGLWEGAYKIAIYFNMLFSLPLTVHYIPRFSRAANLGVIKAEIQAITKIIIPVALVMIYFVHLFDEILIEVLFSKDFTDLHEVLVWVLLAEVFRIIAGLYLASFMSKQYFMSAILVDVAFFLAYIFFIWLNYYNNGLNLHGVAFSYFFATFIFLITSYRLHYIAEKKNR